MLTFLLLPSALALTPVPDPPPVPAPPTAPWTLHHADGAGNAFHLAQPAADAPITWTYSPVTPEQSSSGTYSGGDPASGTLLPAQAAPVWQAALALEARAELHAPARAMGTGALRLQAAEQPERAFIVAMGPELSAFEAQLRELTLGAPPPPP